MKGTSFKICFWNSAQRFLVESGWQKRNIDGLHEHFGNAEKTGKITPEIKWMFLDMFKSQFRLLATILLLLVFTGIGLTQTIISSSMDWSNGLFRISASRPLDSGMSPADHPQALKNLERELWPLVEIELGRLAWNHSGSWEKFLEHQPSLRPSMQKIALALEKKSNRLSTDRKFVNAEYSMNLAEIVMGYFAQEKPIILAEIPIGWVPLPDDPWSGIVIYAPSNLPVQGTDLSANPLPALRARILNNNLQTLADPAIDGFQSLHYSSLDQKDDIVTIVGRRPYRAIARALYGVYPCDIILGEDDAKRIMASASGRRSLERGRVVILLDP